MPLILVVDDSETDRVFIRELLREEPLDWLVEEAESAEEAMERMSDVAYDVVITDVMLAGMSGLELMTHVHNRTFKIPVIVISGQNDETAAVQAIRSGAASYVPKSDLAERLGETVRQVLTAVRSEQSYQELIGSAEAVAFQFRLANDPALLAPLLNLVQEMTIGMDLIRDEDRLRLAIAIEEAFVNAMCHGNLELTDREMAEVRSHLTDGRSSQIFANKASEEPYCNRFVHVSLSLSSEAIKVVIRDDGQGYPMSLLETKNGHRGMTLIRNLVDKVSRNKSGNEITLVKIPNRSAQLAAS